jgi:hypothetical protein
MKMRLFLIAVVSFCFSISAFAQINSYKNVPTVNYCEIIENPQYYNKNLIKIFAEQSSGFEFSRFGSQNCKEKYGQIWAEWERHESCGDEKTARLLVNRNKGIEYNYLEGVFVGKFFVKEEGKSGFGHMNSRPFQLVISCVESAVLLPKENSGCTRVDETSPFHYLEYVKTELGIAPSYEIGRKKRQKEKLVWFRLVNNSSCSIIVPTIGKQTELENDTDVLIVYNLTAKQVTSSSIISSSKPDRPATDEKSVPSILHAGRSIYFAVPLRYLKEKFKVFRYAKSSWNISVPFKYADRKKEENYEPFYFANSDLPKEIFKK